MKCKTVMVKTDNEQGFYICNSDSVPAGAKILKQSPKSAPKKEDDQEKAE